MEGTLDDLGVKAPFRFNSNGPSISPLVLLFLGMTFLARGLIYFDKWSELHHLATWEFLLPKSVHVNKCEWINGNGNSVANSEFGSFKVWFLCFLCQLIALRAGLYTKLTRRLSRVHPLAGPRSTKSSYLDQGFCVVQFTKVRDYELISQRSLSSSLVFLARSYVRCQPTIISHESRRGWWYFGIVIRKKWQLQIQSFWLRGQ